MTRQSAGQYVSLENGVVDECVLIFRVTQSELKEHFEAEGIEYPSYPELDKLAFQVHDELCDTVFKSFSSQLKKLRKK